MEEEFNFSLIIILYNKEYKKSEENE